MSLRGGRARGGHALRHRPDRLNAPQGHGAGTYHRACATTSMLDRRFLHPWRGRRFRPTDPHIRRRRRFRRVRRPRRHPGGAGIVVLPDVRGLHPLFEELALRFAEAGAHAVAIDYFSRRPTPTDRGEGFDYQSHVAQCRPRASTPTSPPPPPTSARRGGIRRAAVHRRLLLRRQGQLPAGHDRDRCGWRHRLLREAGGGASHRPAGPGRHGGQFSLAGAVVWGGADQGIGPEAIKRSPTPCGRRAWSTGDRLPRCAPFLLRSQGGRVRCGVGGRLAPDVRFHAARPPDLQVLTAGWWS